MARVTGIGGTFSKSSSDRAALVEWYRTHLGDPDGNTLELWQPV